MTVRTRFCFAMAAAIALGACGGGGGGSDGGTGGGTVSGLPNPGNIVGASPDYIASLNSELAIANSDLVRAGRTELPLSGSATYSGFGSIFDSSLTTNDNTVADLRRRSVVTDVAAIVDFGARTVNVTQDRFRDVEGNSVTGDVNWSGNYASDGRFNARVTGNVGGTAFDTGPDQATVGFFGDQNDSAILGLFRNAPVSNPGSGWLRGSAVTGDFAATSD